MSQTGALFAGSYDYGEVARSILIAITASYAALDLGGRVISARGWARAVWLTGGAIAMGIGIWAMHFKGMSSNPPYQDLESDHRTNRGEDIAREADATRIATGACSIPSRSVRNGKSRVPRFHEA